MTQGPVGRRSRDPGEVHGILLVDKPIGPTSHDLVEWVRRSLRVRRVGHCGTLDPAASGLLVIAVGVATRVVPLLTDVDKRYRARILFGTRTDSGDLEGAVIERSPVDPAILDQAAAAAQELVGDHLLAPPVYSAIKVDGERAYDRARRGEVFDLAARPMSVLSVEDVVPSVDPLGPMLALTLTVSKGTYIRTLAETLGARLSVPTCLAGLRRLSAGPLAVDDVRALHPRAERRDADPASSRPLRWHIALASKVGEADEASDLVARGLIPIDEAVGLPTLTVDLASDALRRLEQGQSLPCDALTESPERHELSLEVGAALAVVARDPHHRLRRWILTTVASPDGAGGGLFLRPQRVLQLPDASDNSPPSA